MPVCQAQIFTAKWLSKMLNFTYLALQNAVGSLVLEFYFSCSMSHVLAAVFVLCFKTVFTSEIYAFQHFTANDKIRGRRQISWLP